MPGRFFFRHLLLFFFFQLLNRMIAPKSLLLVQKFLEIFFITTQSPAGAKKFIPFQSKPFQTSHNIFFEFRFGSFFVRVLYTQNKFSAMMAGKKPVVQSRLSRPHMQITRRRRRNSSSDFLFTNLYHNKILAYLTIIKRGFYVIIHLIICLLSKLYPS